MRHEETVEWRPRQVQRFIRAHSAPSYTARVATDQGDAWLRAVGNSRSAHSLAAEWVGHYLARWLGLSTLPLAILELDDFDQIPFAHGGAALPGPALLTRVERGFTWSGTSLEFRRVANVADLARRVLFDTWTLHRLGVRAETSRNGGLCENHSTVQAHVIPILADTLFFSHEKAPAGRYILKSLDHSHCFSTPDGILDERLIDVCQMYNHEVLGMAPEFWPFFSRQELRQAAHRLRQIKERDVKPILRDLPAAWNIPSTTRAAWLQCIIKRAVFVSDHLEDWLWPQRELEFTEEP